MGLSNFNFAYEIFKKEGGIDKAYILKYKNDNIKNKNNSNLLIDDNKEEIYVSCLNITKKFDKKIKEHKNNIEKNSDLESGSSEKNSDISTTELKRDSDLESDSFQENKSESENNPTNNSKLNNNIIIIEILESFYFADNLDIINDKIRFKKKKIIRFLENSYSYNILLKRFFIYLILFIHNSEVIDKNILGEMISCNNDKKVFINKYNNSCYPYSNEEEIVLSNEIIDVCVNIPFDWAGGDYDKYNGFISV